MRYDDLIGIPYKEHGRSKSEGFDCYGLCVEMCRRAGTPLADPYSISSLESADVGDLIGGVNLARTDGPVVGGIVECEYGGFLHAGYVVSRTLMIHATTDKGVRVSPIAAMRAKAFYRVV